MFRKFLAAVFGLYEIDWGFATGRHWLSINGKEIYQGGGADVWMRDEQVDGLIKAVVLNEPQTAAGTQQVEGGIQHDAAIRRGLDQVALSILKGLVLEDVNQKQFYLEDALYKLFTDTAFQDAKRQFNWKAGAAEPTARQTTH